MTAVDVLAVFDRAKEWVDCDLSICDDENRPDELRHGLTEARAAVAELVKAVGNSLAHVERRATLGAINEAERADMPALRAALARVGSAA